MHYPLLDGRPQPPVITAGDLRAGRCELGLLAEADVALGRRVSVPEPVDPMRERFGQLGRDHEQQVGERLSAEHGGGEVAVVPAAGPGGYARAHARTLAALADPGVTLLQDAPVRGARFMGRVDHLVREDGRWVVVESKLARSAHTHALVQAAAYAEALLEDGVELAPFVRLALGDGSRVDTPLEDVLPELARRRARVLEVLDTHLSEGFVADLEDERWRACLRCPACEDRMAERRDVGLVAGVSSAQRSLLLAAGVRTMDDLAGSTGPVEGVDDSRLAVLRSQARLQVTVPTPQCPLPFEVHDPARLAALPSASDGDVFFDFEGDPVYAEAGSPDRGLEYLFGCLTAEGGVERFTGFWAHDLAQERTALIDFLAWLTERRRRWPDLHVYHYAGYEQAALRRMAARHGVHEDLVASLIDEGVFVDLYAVVRSAVRVGSRSYSIKRLEPLYMGDDLRDTDGVTGGGESVLEYERYREAAAAGETREAAERLEALRVYNEYDCRSTLRLRDWLHSHAADAAPQHTPI
ncbi:TM0106 family RecB-like putative nuclease [Janibacter corallicola]|uniref:TM0106 family RecB-like putative nuclease n=1 Tax=Janibacter corallicola TaxID=415212 RepID=UPI00082F2AB3|nr:TM0106 family RecB-like putative nuclease [Janibacter corallicola]